MSIYKSVKPASVCCTVGELKTALADIPDDMSIRSSFDDAVRVAVMQEEGGNFRYCEIESENELSFDQWAAVTAQRVGFLDKEEIAEFVSTHQTDLQVSYSDGDSPCDAANMFGY